MERFHTIRKHEASRRFGKRSHDCLNRHDSHCAATPTTSTLRCVGGINGRFTCRSIAHESRVAMHPQVKPNSRFEYQYAKFQNRSAGNEMLAPPRVRYRSRGGPGGPLLVPCRPGTPAYKFQVKTEGQTCKSHAPACGLPRREPHGPGQLRGHHVSCGLSSRCPARDSSGAATCPVASAPAARPGAAPGSPRVLRPQLPLPGPG
jgi:hypothetical protein